MSNEILSNQQVELLGACKVEDMKLQSLSPKYRTLNIIVSLVIGFVIIGILLLLAVQPFISMPGKYLNYYHIAVFVVVFLTLWSALYSFFADPKKQYALREFDVHFQSGLLFFRTVSQPIMRIQHIEIERGPLERSAGLATLQVFSAGGAHHTFEIPGLTYEKAIELRQFILNHKDVSQNG